VTPGPVLAQSRVKTCLKTINYQSAHMSTRFEARSAGSIAICELFLAFSYDFCSDVDQIKVLCVCGDESFHSFDCFLTVSTGAHLFLIISAVLTYCLNGCGEQF
jgi:hypothetical protein